MNYRILVIDDDEHTHVIIKSMLKGEFDLVHAKDGQGAIDILSKESFNLIISDIHMPGITGLEFLESLMTDEDKKGTPVLIMTNLPTVEKEKKALNLGAADFINKVRFIDDQEGVRKQIRMKLVSNVSSESLTDDLIAKKNALSSKVMEAAVNSDFEQTSSILCKEISNQFEADYVALWSIHNSGADLISSEGLLSGYNYSGEIQAEQGFQLIKETHKPYLTNHIFNENCGFMLDFSKENELAAEIAIPLFELDERALLMNNMQTPEDAKLFGILFLKRNKLYSTEEYELISHLVMQFGSILWRLHSKGQ